jgi:hypothetical protein
LVPLAGVAGVIGAGVPEPMVLVPMLLEPMGALLPDMAPDGDESLEGVVAAGGITVVVLVSSFLLQAPSVSKADNASDVTARVLIFELNMGNSFERQMIFHGARQIDQDIR